MTEGTSADIDRSGVRRRATAAFSALGNETRLEILFTLWDVDDPLDVSPDISFSELRKRTGVRDSGHFNYHLEKLLGEFVRKTEAGYTLTEAGMQVIQTIVETVGVEEPTCNPVESSKPCPVCDGTTEFRYGNGHLFLCCIECPGLYDAGGIRPDGMLTSTECTRSAFAGRDLLEVSDAVGTRAKLMFETMIQGVCSECLGVVTHSLLICDDHDFDGPCETCGSRFEARIELTCAVCKHFAHGPVRSLMSYHPAVRSLYIDHDVPFAYNPDPLTLLTRRLWPSGDIEQSVVSADPPAVRVTLGYEGGSIAYTVDENLDITDITTE